MATRPPSSSRPPDAPLRVLSLNASHLVAVRGPLVIASWRRAMDLDATRIAHSTLRDLGKRYAGEAVCLVMIRASVPPPGDDVRRELVAMVRSGAGVLRGAAVIAQGSAFVGALVRSVVSGMVMIVRPTFPMKVFGATLDAASWVGSLAGGAGNAREVEVAINEATKRLDTKASLERVSRPPPSR